MHVTMVLDDGIGANANQQSQAKNQWADQGIAPACRKQHTARRATAAHSEAVSGRWVRRSPQEVGFMMALPRGDVKALLSPVLRCYI
jgi:hypothetical protein